MKKTRFVYTMIMAAAMVMTLLGCDKENKNEQLGLPKGALRISTEGFTSDTKVSVSGRSVQWVNGDRIKLGTAGSMDNKTVVVKDSLAYIENFTVPTDAHFYGIYPDSLTYSGTLGGTSEDDEIVVTLPKSYTYNYAGGRQILPTPLIGKADPEAQLMKFRHVSAAVHVMVRNEAVQQIKLSRIVVSSKKRQLSGDVKVQVGIGQQTVTPTIEALAEGVADSVEITFENTYVYKYNNKESNIFEMQIPIAPGVQADDSLEIRVYSIVEGLKKGQERLTYQRSANISQTLSRNKMVEAKIRITLEGESMTEVIPYFSINKEGDKVMFSQGNLQWSYQNGATHETADGTGVGVFRFAEEQYIFLATTNCNKPNYQSSPEQWYDLFAWGTSGWNSGATEYQPYSMTTYSSSYTKMDGTTMLKYSLTGDYKNADWGIYNAISNGGNKPGLWRTLTENQFSWMLSNRGTSSQVGKNDNGTYLSVARVKIIPNGKDKAVLGLIVFPDNYIRRGGPRNVALGSMNMHGEYADVTTLTYEKWQEYEKYGCAFLPGAGRVLRRDGNWLYSINSQQPYSYWSSYDGKTWNADTPQNNAISTNSNFGGYWTTTRVTTASTSSYNQGGYAWHLFNDKGHTTFGYYAELNLQLSVRLVQDM